MLNPSLKMWKRLKELALNESRSFSFWSGALVADAYLRKRFYVIGFVLFVFGFSLGFFLK